MAMVDFKDVREDVCGGSKLARLLGSIPLACFGIDKLPGQGQVASCQRGGRPCHCIFHVPPRICVESR